MLEREPVYRNFCLAELSHLSDGQLFNFDPDGNILSVKENALSELEKRLEWGKRQIDSNTKPGDKILMEFPDKWDKEVFLKIYGKTKGAPYWESIMEKHVNFYYELAEYARKNGRIVESIEPRALKPASRFFNEMTRQQPAGSEEERKREYLTTQVRNRVMHRKIQLLKPKMVLVAGGHSTYLEHAMKPKKVIEYTFRTILYKENYLQGLRAASFRVKKERTARAVARKANRTTSTKHG